MTSTKQRKTSLASKVIQANTPDEMGEFLKGQADAPLRQTIAQSLLNSFHRDEDRAGADSLKRNHTCTQVSFLDIAEMLRAAGQQVARSRQRERSVHLPFYH